MTEAEMKAEMRLYALENLVCVWFAAMSATGPEPERGFAGLREAMLARAQILTFPSLGPALSDLAAAEFEAATDRLLKLQESYLDRDHQ